MLWALIGVVVIAVLWAIISSYGRKSDIKMDPYAVSTAAPAPDFNEPEAPKVDNWQSGSKAEVSSNFGKGGIPSGVSQDSGHIATSKVGGDDDWMKNAKPFEPRSTNLNLDEDHEELTEAI